MKRAHDNGDADAEAMAPAILAPCVAGLGHPGSFAVDLYDQQGNVYPTHYATLPYAGDSLEGCATKVTPNNDWATDSEINMLSHESLEMVTDPDGTGWTDAAGYEMADKCELQYGPSVSSWGADLVVNGYAYSVQEEWSNAGGGCAMALPAPTPTPTPSPIPNACVPRPVPQVSSTRSAPGTLTVTISPPTMLDDLQLVQFGAVTSAVINAVGLTYRDGVLSIPVSGDASFTVTRVTPGEATTVPFTVTDTCGTWSSFVGGSANSF